MRCRPSETEASTSSLSGTLSANPNPNPESRAPVPFVGSVSHPLSIDPAKTWVGLSMLGGLGLMLLGLARGIGGRDLRVLAPGIVFLGVLMSMIGIVQKALWSGKVYGFWEPVNTGAVAFGPFINRNHFAGWMLLALPVAVGYFASLVAKGMVGVKPGWRNRIIWFSTPDASRAVLTGFALLVMGFALTLTLSRSGISCFLLAMMLSAFHVLRRQTSAAKGRLLGAYLALVVVAAVAWVGIDAIGARFAEVDWKLGGRAGAWGDAWRIHQAFPWFGTGLNTYGSATLLLQQFEKATAHYVEAHNDYLQLLVEGGWLVDGAGAGAGGPVRAGGAPPVPRGARRQDGLLDPPGRGDGDRRHRVPGNRGVQPADARERSLLHGAVRGGHQAGGGEEGSRSLSSRDTLVSAIPRRPARRSFCHASKHTCSSQPKSRQNRCSPASPTTVHVVQPQEPEGSAACAALQPASGPTPARR